MLHTVLMTSLTPLSNTDEINCWDNRPFTTVWPEPKLKKSQGVTRAIKKKAKRVRTAYTTEQLKSLENIYSCHKYIDSQNRKDLAKTLKIGEKCIKIWFQNRRMKEKRESSESSSDTSSDMCPNEVPLIPAPINVSEFNPNQLEYVNEIQSNQFNSNQEPVDYQLPPIYQYDSNIYESQNVPASTQNFLCDSNVYPTQYYPNIPEYNYTGVEHEFHEYGSGLQNYWSGNNCDTMYF